MKKFAKILQKIDITKLNTKNMPNMKNQQQIIPFGINEFFGTLFDIIITLYVIGYKPKS